MFNRTFFKSFIRLALVFVLLFSASSNVNYQKAWAMDHTVSTGWILATHGNSKTINIDLPDNAIGITSSRIRWKGYTRSMYESSTGFISGTFTFNGEKRSGTINFPGVPEGGSFFFHSIGGSFVGEVPHYNAWGVSLTTPYFGAGLTSGLDGTLYPNWAIEPYFGIQSAFNYTLELAHGAPVHYILSAGTSYHINRNSLNSSININGGDSILCPIDDLNSATISEWVPLQGLTEGTNNLVINVAGSCEVYYEVEYTYTTNKAPNLTLTTSDNQGLNTGRGDFYAALLT